MQRTELFARRRRAFMDRLEPGSAALVTAAPVSVRSNDVEYRYRQSSDLYYLTGFPEPEAAALLLPGHPKEEFVLFVRPRDPEKEIWVGARAGVEGAMEHYGADRAYVCESLGSEIGRYVADRERLYLSSGRDEALAQRVLRWMQEWQQARPRTGAGPTALLDAGTVLHEMRLRKSEEEIERMRRAIAATAKAHAAVMRERRPGVLEYEVEALLEYNFRRHGASGPAYPSIVASGPNATILHYTENDRSMRDGDLLLVDAGAEYDCYCADITRTYPVGPGFSAPQRAVYDVVAAAQEAAIATAAPGATIDAVHQTALRVIVEGLLHLGLLQGSAEEARSKEFYRPFYMHRTSHWLGMDVHDVGSYRMNGGARKLEPGMVLTVEPGIYVSAGNDDVGPEWRGIGVRIEDDVLVTPSGNEVLSAGIPKLPEEVR